MSGHAADRLPDEAPEAADAVAPSEAGRKAAPEGPGPSEAARKAEHRRRVDRVFGAVLADVTEDERDDDRPADGTHEDWLRRNVPPHHG